MTTVKVGDMLEPISDWNRSTRPAEHLAARVEVLEITKAQSQSGVLFTVATNNGQLRQLDAAWFKEQEK